MVTKQRKEGMKLFKILKNQSGELIIAFLIVYGLVATVGLAIATK